MNGSEPHRASIIPARRNFLENGAQHGDVGDARCDSQANSSGADRGQGHGGDQGEVVLVVALLRLQAVGAANLDDCYEHRPHGEECRHLV